MNHKSVPVCLFKDDLEQIRQKAETLKKFGEILSELKEESLTDEEKRAVRLAREARKRLAEEKRKKV